MTNEQEQEKEYKTKTDDNPKRPKTEVTNELAKAWLKAHGHGNEAEMAEIQERIKKSNKKRQIKETEQ